MSHEHAKNGTIAVSLADLAQGFPHLSPIGAAMIAQAPVVCLDHNGHEPGTHLPVTGFDWWLGNDDNLFQHKARLEVSGILRGRVKHINSRLKARLKRTWQAESLPLPGFVVVVEFSYPQAKVLRQ